MRIQIEGGVLHSAATWAARLVPRNPTNPVMGGVLLSATDELRVSATDGDMFGTVTVPATVEVEDQIIVSAELLDRIAKTIPAAGKVTLERGPRGLAMQFSATRWSLPELSTVDAWEAFPDLGELVGEIPADVLSRALSRVLPAVSTKPPPHEITGVSGETGEVLTLTATDRYRIASACAEWKPAPSVADQKLILPVGLLKTMTDAISGSTAAVEIYSNGNMVGFVSPPYRMAGRLLAGTYLNWQPIFASPEKNTATTVTVDVAELSLVVAQVSATVEQKTGFDLLRLEFAPERIGVFLATDTENEADSTVEPHGWSGEPLTVGVTPRYLLDALACLGSPMAVLVFTAATTKPFMLRPADKDGVVVGDGYGHVLVTRKLPDTWTAS